MIDTYIPRVLAIKYARFVDDRQFERMREIMVEGFTSPVSANCPRVIAGMSRRMLRSLFMELASLPW